MGLFKTMIYFAIGMKCFDKVSKSVTKAIDRRNKVTIIVSDGNQEETIIESTEAKDEKNGKNKK